MPISKLWLPILTFVLLVLPLCGLRKCRRHHVIRQRLSQEGRNAVSRALDDHPRILAGSVERPVFHYVRFRDADGNMCERF